MAKILIPAYLSHRNFNYVREIMDIEGIANESRCLNFIVMEYRDLVEHRIKALQGVIRDYATTNDELRAKLKKLSEKPPEDP